MPASSDVVTARRTSTRARRLGASIAVAAALALTLSACTSTKTGKSDGLSPVAGSSQTTSGSPGTGSSSQAPDDSDAVITTAPAAATDLSPRTPVTVSVADGTITSVKLLTPADKVVSGALSADSTSWHSTEVLGYGKTYRLSVEAKNAAGRAFTKSSSFSTLAPSNKTAVYLNTTGGTPLTNGATYGVGIVPVAHFDEPVTNKAAAERALQVTTVPAVQGVWNWVSDTDAHWRPQSYLATGTQVTVAADIYGVRTGHGVYGQADEKVSFKIGAKHVSIADDRTHKVKVYFNDKLVRTMPTSMGQGGYVTGVGGQQISLWTMPGTYTVLSHHNPVLMDSSTFGLPVNSAKGYKEFIYQATQISTDGIYLHQLDSTVWAQGHQDLSHGCLNLNYKNAHFFYTTSQIGDIVTVLHTGGPKLQIWQNGDWSVPWATWVKGSAL